MSPASQPPNILDGGLSRDLIRRGAPFAQPEWSALALIQTPHLVRAVHADFLAAGAQVATTASYALVPFHVGEARFWGEGAELAGRSGRMAREAVGGGSVAGCLPPVFGSYEPRRFRAGEVGRYLDVLVNGLEPWVDFWLGETLSLIAEGEAVLAAVRRGGGGKRVWVSFCPDDGEGARTEDVRLRSGESVEEVARWAVGKARAGELEALAFNCCRPEFIDAALDVTVKVFEEERARNGDEGIPRLGVYANAFVPRSNEYAANEDISPTDDELTPEAYAKMAVRWRRKGADIVGGCCGIGHEHIRAVAAALAG